MPRRRRPRARVHRGAAPARAHASGGAPTGPVAADGPTTALAVFQLQDDVVSGIVALTDGVSGPLLDAMSPTLSSALDRRDAAVADVHRLAPAPSADDARVHVQAHASGGAVVGTFDTVMPQVPAMLDDETQQIDALLAGGQDPAGKTLLRNAKGQILGTAHTINVYWPPVPAED
jgi:hypothetical protein